MLSTASFEALAAILQRRVEAGQDDVLAEAVRRKGWTEFASRYPETARVLHLRLWEVAWTGFLLLASSAKAHLGERLVGLQGGRFTSWVFQISQWLKQKFN